MNRRRVRVAIVGAGFGGIAVALRLAAAGHRDVVVFEARAEPGGTWSANTYPGVACDAPSHLYSYSFAPKRDWSRRFAPGPEIRDYLGRCLADAGLSDAVRPGARVTAATWTGRDWLVELADGARERFDVIVAATGQLSVPNTPAIPGLDGFTGVLAHTADWPADLDLAGRRVAVVGTGASAVQLIPSIAPAVAALTVFQRCAPYVFEKPDASYSPRLRALYRRIPLLPRAARAAIWLAFEAFTLAFWKWPGLMWPLERWHAAALRATIADPALRRALTPDHRAGCKRILIATDYHRTFTLPHVALETDPIVAVEPDAVVTARGRHEVDAIVFATGFRTDSFAQTMTVTGRRGTTLHQVWADGPAAFYGLSVPDFPNFFLVYGPNTNLGSGSIVYMLETQAAHIVDAVDILASAAEPGSLEVRTDALDRYRARISRRAARATVWNSGCRSWYRDSTGRDIHNWPGFMTEYRRAARRVNPRDYHLHPLTAGRGRQA
jgi:cation diffusion facilitator CzcD-associated flavoprotein CzcO